MLQYLPPDIIVQIAGHAAVFCTLRCVVRIPWTTGLVRHVALSRLGELRRSRRRAAPCACADCADLTVDALVFGRDRAVTWSSPYCRTHVAALFPELHDRAVFFVGGDAERYDIFW